MLIFGWIFVGWIFFGESGWDKYGEREVRRAERSMTRGRWLRTSHADIGDLWNTSDH